jgi:DNA-binding transcriptional MerR regulator
VRKVRIQDLAAATGVAADSIRYYEKAGLLPEPGRSDNNYRDYKREHARRLVLIRNGRALGMSLDEIRTLLDFIDHPHGDCQQINDSVAEHLRHVRQRLAELRQLEKQLKALLTSCTRAGSERDCAIVLALSDEAFDASGARRSSRSHV